VDVASIAAFPHGSGTLAGEEIIGIALCFVAEPDFECPFSEVEFRGVPGASSFFSLRISKSPGLTRKFGDSTVPSYR
jgi:hypothetical protein